MFTEKQIEELKHDQAELDRISSLAQSAKEQPLVKDRDTEIAKILHCLREKNYLWTEIADLLKEWNAPFSMANARYKYKKYIKLQEEQKNNQISQE